MSSFIETQPSTLHDKSSEGANNSLSKITEDEAVGTLIREARIRKGLTQKELAALAGITPVQLCRIENHECIPSKNSLKMISSQVGIPYTDLIIHAGYNNMAGEQLLFKKNGDILNINQIVSSIYRADSDLLYCFTDFEEFGTEVNTEVIKLLLYAMRKEAKLKTSKTKGLSGSSSYFKTTFQALKEFIISSLKPLSG